jgi:hypothetical protein
MFGFFEKNDHVVVEKNDQGEDIGNYARGERMTKTEADGMVRSINGSREQHSGSDRCARDDRGYAAAKKV